MTFVFGSNLRQWRGSLGASGDIGDDPSISIDLLLTGIKRVQENKKDEDKSFAVKLNLSGYKPDEIKVQLRGQELTVTGQQRSEEDGLQWSRDFHRRILLPDDVDLSSVSSRLQGRLANHRSTSWCTFFAERKKFRRHNGRGRMSNWRWSKSVK